MKSYVTRVAVGLGGLLVCLVLFSIPGWITIALFDPHMPRQQAWAMPLNALAMSFMLVVSAVIVVTVVTIFALLIYELGDWIVGKVQST